MSLTMFRPAWFGRRLGSAVLAVGLTTGALVGLAAAPVSAEAGCTGDLRVVVPDTVQTPLGRVTVTTSATNVVTEQLAPTAPNTLVLGVPFSYRQLGITDSPRPPNVRSPKADPQRVRFCASSPHKGAETARRPAVAK